MAILWYLITAITFIAGKSREGIEGLIFLTCKLFGYSNENAAYIVAQAKHESNNFESDLYDRAKNAFGMRKASKRKQTIKGTTTNSYVTYHNVVQSTVDRIYWDQYNNILPSKKYDLITYVYMLKQKRYFEADKALYLAATALHLKQFQEEGKKTVSLTVLKVIGGLLAIIGTVFGLRKWRKR